MQGFDLFTLDAGELIDEIADSLETCELQSVGVSEGETLDFTSAIVASLGRFNLMIEQDHLRAGTAKYFVSGPDVAQYGVGVFHVESKRSWI